MEKTIFIAIALALMPISEIRGAIPLVLALSNDNVATMTGIALSVLANMTVPFVAYSILDLLERFAFSRSSPSIARSLYMKILSYGRRKALGLRKSSYIALALFVGVPLPFTGAWTGTLIAYVLGFDRRKSIIAIDIGVLIATTIVLVVSILGIGFLREIFTS